MRLILASASPRRVELIGKIPHLEVTVQPSRIEEVTDKTDDGEAVADLAEQKARAVASSRADGIPVLGADTVVVCGERLGKPKSAADAERMFRLLCGRTHSVFTGVCLTDGIRTLKAYEETRVTFAPYDDAVVANYIATGKPFDKAGGYGVQDEELAPLIERIDGDYDNVLGLPVGLVGKLLTEINK